MDNYISVIVPTKNGGEQFRESLEMIFSQEIDSPVEVVVIDSGSTDQTLGICADYPVKLIQIPAASFNHSTTRNLAISKSCGDICVLTVQDAIPADKKWLARLVAPLVENDKVAGVFGQQVARDDASFVTRYCLQLYYREWRSDWKHEHEQSPIESADWNKLSFEQKRIHSRFDNTNSCIRRSVWQEIPFPVVPFAEDIAWALAVLQSGFSIVWKPTARVFHSHERPLAYILQRSYVESKTLAVLFNGSSVLLTQQMLCSVLEWLTQEASKYLRLTSPKQSWKKTKVEQLAEADSVWQLKVSSEKIAMKSVNLGSKSDAFSGTVSLKNFMFLQFYRGITGPMWFRKACRNIFRSGRFSLGKKGKGTTSTQAIGMELHASHRYFTNLLLAVHFEHNTQIVDGESSIRFAAAIMVAGSFLGKNMKSVNSSEALHEMLDGNGNEGALIDRELWQLLASWCKQDFTQGSTAIAQFDKIMVDGV